MSVDIFTMTDFKNQYHKDIILDFIDNPVITNTNTMKRVIPFQFGFLSGVEPQII